LEVGLREAADAFRELTRRRIPRLLVRREAIVREQPPQGCIDCARNAKQHIDGWLSTSDLDMCDVRRTDASAFAEPLLAETYRATKRCNPSA
jgi:ABC-type transporter Mla MlaB component